MDKLIFNDNNGDIKECEALITQIAEAKYKLKQLQEEKDELKKRYDRCHLKLLQLQAERAKYELVFIGAGLIFLSIVLAFLSGVF